MGSQYINNLDFAQKKQTLSGEFLLGDMSRLQEVISDNQQNKVVSFTLSSDEEQGGMPAITLAIETELAVPCQRCFEAMPFSYKLTFDYVISEEEPEGLEELDEIDWLEPEREMDLLNLVEDELLLALPFAPVHDEDCGSGEYESGERVSPFAVLKDKFK